MGRESGATDVSPLARCAALEYLSLSDSSVTDVSAFAGCATRQTLDLMDCLEVTDVSGFGGLRESAPALAPEIGSDGRVCARELREAAHARPQGLSQRDGLVGVGWPGESETQRRLRLRRRWRLLRAPRPRPKSNTM
mmetsp:Transcript_9043/g.28239  ORF Transcript_9043/g.28239 Transcript_9043/m.28239 type:complete len:137 (+) Transcript_9043:378-788(+)